jgi:5-methylcytosine-specific restriction endonuclease McrA
MNPCYAAIAERANHRCEYCQAPEVVFNFPFEVEHIIPIFRQGANNEANLALACPIPTLKFNFSIPERINGVSIFRLVLNLARLLE